MLISILLLFSDFKFDLCHDFSFWKSKTGRCIPKKLNDNEHYEFYSFPPLCNRTEFDCMNSVSFTKYCPNKDENCESHDKETHFFCSNSKTCIPKGELI